MEADLLNEESLATAIEGSKFVVHTASPVVFDTSEEEVVGPAVNGTMAVVRACHSNRVQRLIITSSITAVTNVADKPVDRTYDENHFSDPNLAGLSFYAKSKILAEKAAWDFHAALPENVRFELVTICPGLI